VKVDFAFICDYADVERKINALGIGFDTIFASQIPYRHPTFFFVMQLRANVVEVGKKRLELHLIDEDGEEVIPPLRTGIDVSKPTGLYSLNRVAMQLGGVEFKKHGAYSIRATVDGSEVAAVDFKVSPPPRSGSAS